MDLFLLRNKLGTSEFDRLLVIYSYRFYRNVQKDSLVEKIVPPSNIK